SQLKRRIMLLLDRDFHTELTSPAWWRAVVHFVMALAVLSLSLLSVRPARAVPGPRSGAEAPQAKEAPAAKPQEKTEANESVWVVDSQGKAKDHVTFYRSDTVFRSLGPERATAEPLGQSSSDGSFQLSAADLKAARERRAQIVAVADGSGPAFVDPS